MITRKLTLEILITLLCSPVFAMEMEVDQGDSKRTADTQTTNAGALPTQVQAELNELIEGLKRFEDNDEPDAPTFVDGFHVRSSSLCPRLNDENEIGDEYDGVQIIDSQKGAELLKLLNEPCHRNNVRCSFYKNQQELIRRLTELLTNVCESDPRINNTDELHTNLIKILIEYGAQCDDINITYLALCDDLELMELLINRGATQYINEALCVACMDHKTHLIKLLLNAGADINEAIDTDYLHCYESFYSAKDDPLLPTTPFQFGLVTNLLTSKIPWLKTMLSFGVQLNKHSPQSDIKNFIDQEFYLTATYKESRSPEQNLLIDSIKLCLLVDRTSNAEDLTQFLKNKIAQARSASTGQNDPASQCTLRLADYLEAHLVPIFSMTRQEIFDSLDPEISIDKPQQKDFYSMMVKRYRNTLDLDDALTYYEIFDRDSAVRHFFNCARHAEPKLCDKLQTKLPRQVAQLVMKRYCPDLAAAQKKALELTRTKLAAKRGGSGKEVDLENFLNSLITHPTESDSSSSSSSSSSSGLGLTPSMSQGAAKKRRVFDEITKK